MKTLNDVLSQNWALVQQESLIIEATELISSIMKENSVTKAELARKLNKSKAYVTQCLSGERNLTLRTLADLFTALEYQPQFGAIPLSRQHRKAVHRLYPVGGWAYENSVMGPSIIDCAASADAEPESELCGAA